MSAPGWRARRPSTTATTTLTGAWQVLADGCHVLGAARCSLADTKWEKRLEWLEFMISGKFLPKS